MNNAIYQYQENIKVKFQYTIIDCNDWNNLHSLHVDN